MMRGGAGSGGNMVLVEGGTLLTSNALDGVEVTTFYIGRYEVTWGEWKKVRAWALHNDYDLGSAGKGCGDDYPVRSVSWYDILKWSNAKSEMEGLTPVYTVSGEVYTRGEPDHFSIKQDLSANGYRLPLEAEWEFAARGGNRTNGYTFSGSDELDEVGWYSGNSYGAECAFCCGRGIWPVGQKAANELGLYDMSGNVGEWCWDRHGSRRRVRGSSWVDRASYSGVAVRYFLLPHNKFRFAGFRLAQSSGY